MVCAVLASRWKGECSNFGVCSSVAARAKCGQVCGYAYVSGELHTRSPVSVAVGGHLVQAHLARRSLLSRSDEAALSHEELCFHSPCVRASEAPLRPSAQCQASGASTRAESLGPGGERLIQAPGGNVSRWTRLLSGPQREARLVESSSIVFPTCPCLGR